MGRTRGASPTAGGRKRRGRETFAGRDGTRGPGVDTRPAASVRRAWAAGGDGGTETKAETETEKKVKREMEATREAI